MSTKILITYSPSQTKKFAQVLAKDILKKPLTKSAFTLALEGELGSGKTTFLQGLAKGLGIKKKILSPTFIIMRKYQLSTNNKQLTTKSRKLKVVSCKLKSYFYHIDCYRISQPKEILDLGFKEIIQNPQNIVAVEWADQIRKIMPKKTIWLSFKFINKNQRKIVIKFKKGKI